MPFTFRQHIGMVILVQMRRRRHVVCRACALAIGRRTQNRTLLTGWWSWISLFSNTWAVLANAAGLRRAARLAAPAGGDPGRRLDPGRPALVRVGVLVPIVAMTGVAVVVVLAVSRAPSLGGIAQGDCVTFASGLTEVECAGPHDGRVIAVTAAASACPEAAEEAYSEVGRPTNVVCIDTGTGTGTGAGRPDAGTAS